MKKIISVHIAKTAGSTFLDFLTNNFSVYWDKERLFLKRTLGIKETENEKIIINEQVIHGHFFANKYNWMDNTFKIIWMRDPVERIISQYYYWKANPQIDDPIVKLIAEEKLDIVDFASIPSMRDMQAYVLNGEDLNNFDFVGITEEFSSGMERLKNIFPLPIKNFSFESKRVNNIKPFVDISIRNIIAQNNELDIEKYSIAYEKFNLTIR